MAIVLSCTVPPRDTEILVARIRNELADLGIDTEERMNAAMHRFEQALPSGPHLEDVVLLEGVPPGPPTDELIIWNGNFHAKGFVIDPNTGRADYRRKIADVSVEAEQLLAEVQPGRPGKNGQDVFGRIVLPREPRPAKIREGKNVRFDPVARTYHAETSGRIRFVAGILSVDDVFHVAGDVGLRTGNISHPGALIVTRDIQAGAKVVATGDVDVGENIEDAEVETGGSLTVHGGISCKERGMIRVAGNLHARFLRNADLEVGGDLYIDREINQCHIKTRGAVVVTQGRIVGGSIVALRGVETGDLGSEACIPCELTVGKDYTMESIVNEKKAMLEAAKQILLKLRDAVAPLRAKQHALTPPLKQRLVEMQSELEKRENDYQDLEKSLDEVYRTTRASANNRIYVHRKIYPDNLIQIGAQVKRIKDSVPGPMRVGLKKGKLAFFRLKDGETLQDTLAK